MSDQPSSDPRSDDPSINNEVGLYRRVHPKFLVPDENRDCIRLTSGAFQGTETSVALGDDLDRLGIPPELILVGYEERGYALVVLPAGAARQAEQAVCRDHKPDDETHGLIAGKKTGSKQRALARSSAWVVAPPNGCEPPAV